MFVHWIPFFRQLRINYNMFSQTECAHWYPTCIFVFPLLPILTSFNNWKSSVNVENMRVGNLVEKLHKSYYP